MTRELYFDFVSDDGSGAVELVSGGGGEPVYHYQYTSSDLERDKMLMAEKDFNRFSDFWNVFAEDKFWFCLHPLYIHPAVRSFVKEQLEDVNWSGVEDEKWQEMYQRQWNKVLYGPAGYYKPR